MGTSWYANIKRIIKRATGQSIGPSKIRSILVTHIYGSEALKGTDTFSLRESFAHAMRHSTREARRTYDKRTSFEKAYQANKYCADNINRILNYNNNNNNNNDNNDNNPNNNISSSTTTPSTSNINE